MHWRVHGTWRAVIEQPAAINMQPNMLQSTQELSQQVDTLTKACRFEQITHYPEDIVWDQDIVFGNMVLYVEIVQALDTAKDHRACIDNALHSRPV